MSVPVVTTVGSRILTARAGKRAGGPSIAGTLRLYTNNVTPTVSSVPGDFTEATFSGYARRAVVDDSFDPATLDGNDAVAPNVSNPFQWVCGVTGQTVLGWYYVLTSGELLAAMKFDNPQAMVSGAKLSLALSLVGTPFT